jgi:colanic acid/amylovoran biosynthesis glycosyltransferase
VIIAYLIPIFPMPSQTFIRRELAALEARGWTIHRFAMRRFSGQAADPADQVEQDQTHYLLDAGVAGLTSSLFALLLGHPRRFLTALKSAVGMGLRSEKGLLRNLIYFAEACYIRRRLAECGARHLHAHFGTNSAAIAMLCHLLGGPPFSITCHGPDEFDSPRALSLRQKVRHAAFVVAISHFTRSQLLRWSEYRDWSKIHVVYAGVSPRYLNHGPAPIPDAPRLVNIGRIVEQKGQTILIHAVASLVKRGIDVDLIIASDGPMRSEIERLIDQFDVRDNVRLVGYLDDQGIFDEILAARAMVLPSFAEGLPSVLLEALALGRPVITTSIAGHPELVEQNVSGWLIPAGDVESLVSAMSEVLTSTPAKLAQMGCAGAARVAEQHDPESAITKLAELFSTHHLSRNHQNEVSSSRAAIC